jgi:hypothetical protein
VGHVLNPWAWLGSITLGWLGLTGIEAVPAAYRRSALVLQNAAHALALVPAGAAGLPAVAEARELLALPSGAGL